MPKTFTYADARTTQVGPMICACCHAPIETGLFRYRETRDAFIVHHRACSQDDPHWQKMDADLAKCRAKQSVFEADLRALMTKHGKTDPSDFVCDVIAALDLHDHFY